MDSNNPEKQGAAGKGKERIQETQAGETATANEGRTGKDELIGVITSKQKDHAGHA